MKVFGTFGQNPDGLQIRPTSTRSITLFRMNYHRVRKVCATEPPIASLKYLVDIIL